MATKQKCEGKRRGYHRGSFGEFKCQRQAKGTVETQVGVTRHHGCCGDDQCGDGDEATGHVTLLGCDEARLLWRGTHSQYAASDPHPNIR